jgi:carbonic anhydrase
MIAQVQVQMKANAKTMTPLQVLQSLQQGNARFWTGQATRPEVSAFERRAMIQHQFPSTAVLGCADSRVPVEIVLDQGLGDLFVVRVAGNCLGTTIQASLEYAIFHLDVKVLLVMGHEGCGAIKAAQLPLAVIQKETQNLALVLQQIKQGLHDADSDHVSHIIDARAKDRELGAMNVRNQVERLTQDVQILERVNRGHLIIVGAFYELSSGIVDFMMQVSMPDPDMKPAPGVQSRFNPVTKELVFA